MRTLTVGMKTARVRADDEARKAIARVERALAEALEGEALRGMPEIGGRVFGLRVDAEGSSFARLPRNRRVLIVDAKGRLRAATLGEHGVSLEEPSEEDVVASVLEPYLRTVQRGMTLHMESATKRTEVFAKIAALAAKLAAALG